jgi:tRNA G46 methylase TrmB
MNELEYKNFYDRVGKINGWDFSKLQVTSEVIEWNFYEEVIRRSKSTDVLLDVGTGGGENVISIASSFHFILCLGLIYRVE